jgi:ketosteroid isomerase-like protein
MTTSNSPTVPVSENMAILNKIYEAFNTRDILTFFDVLSPDVTTIIQCPELPFDGIFNGYKGSMDFLKKMGAYIDSYVSFDRYIDSSSRIAAVGRTYGTIKSNGYKFDVPIIHLWDFKDGKVIRIEVILDIPAVKALLYA